MPQMIDLIDRAATDPKFLMELQRDPFSAAQAAGIDVSREQVAALLGMPSATDGQMAEVLQARLSYASKTMPCAHNNFSDGCSGVAGGGGTM
jgi:hypothetical protein